MSKILLYIMMMVSLNSVGSPYLLSQVNSTTNLYMTQKVDLTLEQKLLIKDKKQELKAKYFNNDQKLTLKEKLQARKMYRQELREFIENELGVALKK